MVNGAGLAMATMDIIKLYGESPANFGCGGWGERREGRGGFEVITADPKVKGVLVDVFGGIMKCDVSTKASVVAAVSEVGLRVPLVVHLKEPMSSAAKTSSQHPTSTLTRPMTRQKRPEDRSRR